VASIAVGGATFVLTDEGYLERFEDWTEGMAVAIADAMGISPLTDDHWKAIRCLRDYYAEFHIAPPIKKACRVTGLTMERLEELFPGGPAKVACRIAGLPKPVGCI
jgi:TusE/DsrC/DsvC family sulfur relay protein